MKKLFAILVACLLLVGVAPASAAIKAGGKCVVAGQKRTSGDKRYTCVKSGKKLIWSNGRVTTQTPTSRPSQGNLPKFQRLYRSVKEKFQQQSLSGINLETVYSPTVDLVKANILLDQFKDAISFYVSKFGQNKKIVIIFMSEKDKDWYNKKVISYEGPNTNDDWWGSKHCAFTAGTQCGRGTNASPVNILYEVVGSSWKPSNYSRVSPNHESVHIYQKSIIGDGMYQKFPAWFGEGQANFLGFVTSNRFLDVTSLRSQTIRSLSVAFPNMNNFAESDWVTAIDRCDNSIDFCVSNGLGYSLGMLLNEYLYSIFEPAQIDQVLSDVAAGSSWESAVLTNLRLSREQLNSAAAKYIYTEVQNDRKR